MVMKATIIKVLFPEMYVNVAFVISCLYSAVSLILVKEQRFIRIIYHYHYYLGVCVEHICKCFLLALS